MQFYKNLQQPETGDIRLLPGYTSLNNEQKKAVHELYQNCLEAYSGRGLRAATGMAFEAVKQRLAECADTIANHEEISTQALKPAFPSVIDQDESAINDALLQAVMQLFTTPEEDHDDEVKSDDPEMSSVTEHISRTFLEQNQSLGDIAASHGYQPIPGQQNLLVHPDGALLKLPNGPTGSDWTHVADLGQPAVFGQDGNGMHEHLSKAHRSKFHDCGSEVCAGDDVRTHYN